MSPTKGRNDLNGEMLEGRSLERKLAQHIINPYYKEEQ